MGILIDLIRAVVAGARRPVPQERGCRIDFPGLGDPVLALAASFIAHTLAESSQAGLRVLMRHDLVTGVEDAVAVVVSTEGLLGVFDEIADAKCIAKRMAHGHPRGGDIVVGKIMPREGVPMGHGKDGHLNADEGILDGCSEIIRGIILDIVGDRTQPHHDG